MGMVKRYLMRQQEEGWRSVGNEYVCSRCFSDYAIADFIALKATERTCTYCGRKSRKPIAVEMDEVLSFIALGLGSEYDSPENAGLPYDSREGGWQLVQPTDGWDLVMDGGWLNEDSSGFNSLLEDLQRAFSDQAYVPRNPLSLSESERLRYSWRGFCETVMHKTRFVIFKIKPKRSRNFYDHDDIDSVPAYKILEQIGRMIETHDLVRVVARGTPIFRARQSDTANRPTNAETLGSPPPRKAIQSRMSPAGISVFYGAEDMKTAFLETFEPKDAKNKDSFTFGRFVTARKLRILDLSKVPDVPSIFDELSADRRHECIFLAELAEDISKPVERDGREHYEYVPTQIVAEYFRSVFRLDRKPVDGIMFKSSRKGAGISYCIFSDANGCADHFRERSASKFSFERKRRTLVLTRIVKRSVSHCVAAYKWEPDSAIENSL